MDAIPDEVAKIISVSGNNFHSKVSAHLREKGWHTQISPYYMDNASNKPREIDLIAEKYWPRDRQPYDKSGYVSVRLFIECKFIPQVNVFWFSQKDIESAHNLIRRTTPIYRNNINSLRHHYLHTTRNKVAKLFASESKQNAENEVIYKALNQSLNAMVYLRGKPVFESSDDRRNGFERLFTLEMPVILCNSFDKFYAVDMDNSSNVSKLDDHFQLEVNYAYSNAAAAQVSEYFLLDVVDFTQLDSYLEIIEEDVDTTFHFL